MGILKTEFTWNTEENNSDKILYRSVLYKICLILSLFNDNVNGLFQMVVVTDMVVEEIVEMIGGEVEVMMTVGILRWEKIVIRNVLDMSLKLDFLDQYFCHDCIHQLLFIYIY